jgi:hypothetical protein
MRVQLLRFSDGPERFFVQVHRSQDSFDPPRSLYLIIAVFSSFGLCICF